MSTSAQQEVVRDLCCKGGLIMLITPLTHNVVVAMQEGKWVEVNQRGIKTNYV